MADREELRKQYGYAAMSNKVEQAVRTRDRNSNEATGEVESLRNRSDIGRMGDRVVVSNNNNASSILQKIKKNKNHDHDNSMMNQQPPNKKSKRSDTITFSTSSHSNIAVSGDTILDLGYNIGTSYQPSNDQTRIAYERLLALLVSTKEFLLYNQGSNIIKDAADEVIAILKDDTIRDPEKFSILSNLLTGKASSSTNGSLSNEHFTNITQIVKQLDDYRFNSNNNNTIANNNNTTEEGMDDEMGVAVVFNDEDNESNDNQNNNSDDDHTAVIHSSESSSDDDNDEDVEEEEEDDENVKTTLDMKNVIDDDNDEKQVLVTNKKASTSSKHQKDRILSIHEIDAHFLQRQLSKYITDADESVQKSNEILNIIRIPSNTTIDNNTNTTSAMDIRECENKLLVLLGFDMFDIIQLILHNRIKIWACISIKRAQTDIERNEIESILQNEPRGIGKQVLDEIQTRTTTQSQHDWTVKERMKGLTESLKVEETNSGNIDGGNEIKKNADGMMDQDGMIIGNQTPTELDLDALVLRDGAHTMSNQSCVLPESSWRAMKKGYEEVHVPAIKSIPNENEKLIAIKELPIWTHAAFKGMTELNRIQSKLCNVALTTSENILLCAPTGAGKTNVACLAMLNILGQYQNVQNYTNVDATGTENMYTYDLQAFKIVYIAPMKALVQEVVKNFRGRLKEYGITVRELSGDSSLTRQQIAETQIIVTTPEKWDIITRQGEGRVYAQLVKLVIIDEIHLLHDERGPVLESIIARTIRQVETTSEPIRLLGLSATLPNYTDVATLLRVKPDIGLFFFDHSYRPVPLQMQYIGITERNAFKRFQLQNEICYEKAIDQRRERYQLLIFVHSRAECGKTAKALRDLAIERDELSLFLREGSASQEILREESMNVKNGDLKDVLSNGFAIHHAGMVQEDRELVEDLFADRHVSVLCCTATLAWGVNLPAHAVIIRGTQIYDPSKGRWAELSPLDVLQMLGRAGRPQYDSQGEGIILTQHSQLQYYLSLTNLQLPVESQLIKTLPDHLNAEVVLGSVQSINEAMDWLSYTFLYIRMIQNPSLYGISEENLKDDPTLQSRRRDLVHTAATILEKSHLLRYDRKSGALHATPLGRVASQYYISHKSMGVYIRNMRPNLSEIELLRLVSLSGEFAHITVREEEKLELVKLAGRVPIPVKESPSEPSAKVNMLLQAYISRLKLDGFALVADMAFIQQSAARIMRALFEISLKRNWASLARLCLDLSNMVSYRVWRSQSPLRQFKHVPEVVCRKLERKSDIDWARYIDLTPSDLGELVGVAKMGRVLHKLVHQFPRLELSAQIQPITRSMLRVELTIVPAFQFDIEVHGYSQFFHLLVEDINGEIILHHESFAIKSKDSDHEQVIVFTVAILDPLPPAYFVRVLSDRWLHSISVLPILFNAMILPAKFPPPTELLDLQPLLPAALGESSFTKMFPFQTFNPIQTQTFHDLYKTGNNCLVCAPSNSGKTACAAFAILHMLTANAEGKCVYVSPTDDIADVVHDQLMSLFGTLRRKSMIVRLTGETAPDLEMLSTGKIVVASVMQWDILSRRWRQRKSVQAVTLMIFDELHFLGGESGPTLEILISRTRYISSQLEQLGSGAIRIVGLSASLANARDVGDWMGVPPKNVFNFSPKTRTLPLEIYFQSFEHNNYSGRLMAMAKPVYNAVARHFDGKSALVYVPSKRQAQLTAIDLMTYSESQGQVSFLGPNEDVNLEELIESFREPALKQVVAFGVGFVHTGMVESDWKTIISLYRDGVVRVLVCPADLCWKVRCLAHLVVVMGTESYDGREGRHVDYPIVDLLHMMGRHNVDSTGKCVIMCHGPKKEHLKKLLYDPLPIESHIDSYLHDPLNSEIVTKTISSMQDAIDFLTWTFLYRRFVKNPTYYGLRGTSNAFISQHLSEMVETVVEDLEESKCCRVSDDGEISPLNLGMIASYYYVQYRTIELIASSISAKTKIRGVLEILSAAWEYSALPIRYGEDKLMKILAQKIVHKIPEKAAYDSNTKALILLQCHFSRIPVGEDMRLEQRIVLKDGINLIQAIADVISSNGWLKPALAAMELSQMIVQGLWSKDNVLKQIPHFSDEIIKRCQEYKGEDPVESVFDILALDDEVRNELLQLPDEKMADVAVFCNSYPNIDITFNVMEAEDVTAGYPVQIVVNLEREIDDDLTEDELANLGKVSATLYPSEKKEAWWIVVGDTTTNTLMSLKRTNLRQVQKITLEFLAPEEPGDYELTLFCMSDSYLGCDQEFSIPLSVAAAVSDNEESGEE
jgi:pre-mRNA-splicing helicase BRR2